MEKQAQKMETFVIVFITAKQVLNSLKTLFRKKILKIVVVSKSKEWLMWCNGNIGDCGSPAAGSIPAIGPFNSIFQNFFLFFLNKKLYKTEIK